MKENKQERRKVCFFGPFGQGNFGNESTLQAILYHLRRYLPESEIKVICTNPEATGITHNISAVPIMGVIVNPWNLRNPLARFLRKVFVGIPSEFYRWLNAFRALKNTDMFIVPGTGLLSDAYGLFSWGPYGMFKWSLIAKLRHCHLFFVSVGAGPIYSALGRWLIKSALSLADFRSYRDKFSKEYLKGIGFMTNDDAVYPDLAFSLPERVIPHDDIQKKRRPVVGLGLMDYAGKYSVEKPSNVIYLAYLKNLVIFVRWLLDHDYDVRLLIGDTADRSVTQEFRKLLSERSLTFNEERIIEEPISTVEDLLSQIAATDIVVATRFHNALLALVLNRPVISISFHHKCVSLMKEMGLSEYCQDINYLDADRLIEQFRAIERNSEELKSLIRRKAEEFRRALDEQYSIIFKDPVIRRVANNHRCRHDPKTNYFIQKHQHLS